MLEYFNGALLDAPYSWHTVCLVFVRFKLSKSTMRRWMLPLLSGTLRSISKKQLDSVLQHTASIDDLYYVVLATCLTSDPITLTAYNILQSTLADIGETVPINLLAMNHRHPTENGFYAIREALHCGHKADYIREAIIMTKCAAYCAVQITKWESRNAIHN